MGHKDENPKYQGHGAVFGEHNILLRLAALPRICGNRGVVPIGFAAQTDAVQTLC
jgi:hypothetical protein